MWSLHGFIHGIKWIVFHGHLDHFQKPPLGGRPHIKLGDHGTPNIHDRWYILFYQMWGTAWIDIHWNSIWSRVRSHMISHYTWGSVTTRHFTRPLDTFFWAPTIPWSRLLASVWSVPNCHWSSPSTGLVLLGELCLLFCNCLVTPHPPRYVLIIAAMNIENWLGERGTSVTGLSIQSSLYKCYPYKCYNFIYVKKILLPYKNTIGKTSECYSMFYPFFVNCTSQSVNFEKIKVIIYESVHFKHVITFIPYSLRTSQIFLSFGDPPSLCTFKQFGRGDGKQIGFGSWSASWVLIC